MDKEKYVKTLETSMGKYKNKLEKIDEALKNYKAHNKDHLLAERNNLKEKYKQAEDIYEKLKNSTKENFKEIKESSAEIFDALKDAFHDYSSLLTMDQLYHVKDEVVEYGSEKMTEVEDYIKQKPLVCAAWAFGIGFLVGTVLTRSK